MSENNDLTTQKTTNIELIKTIYNFLAPINLAASLTVAFTPNLVPIILPPFMVLFPIQLYLHHVIGKSQA